MNLYKILDSVPPGGVSYNLTTGELTEGGDIEPSTKLQAKVLTPNILKAYCKFYATQLASRSLYITKLDNIWIVGILK
jgi:hypothetical protein